MTGKRTRGMDHLRLGVMRQQSTSCWRKSVRILRHHDGFGVSFRHSMSLEPERRCQEGLQMQLWSQCIALLVSLPLVLVPGQAKRCLPPAALSCGLYLLFHGSRSNHIMQDLIVNLAILVAAAGRNFENSLCAAMQWYLVVLYFISALHKLNSDWFDPHVSCASSVTGTLLAQYVPSMVPAGSQLSQVALASAPHAAAVFEVLLPGLLTVAPPGRSAAWQGACIRLAVVLGAIFHLMLALPLPPASFYPFSASCLALYPLLVPGACEQLAKRLSSIRLAKLCWIALPGLMLAICAAANRSGAWSSWLKGGHHDVPFEYPPYDLYNAGICWCFGVTAFLVVLALLGPGQEKQKEPVSRATSVAVAATLLLGLGPYLGTRTYPAFAMFSNLRVERAPNHLLLNGGFDVLGLQSDVVEVLDTNSSDLRSFQVDLSQLFTAQTQSYFTDSKLTKALWICPPRWSHEVKDFQPFSAPALGLWQRLISESPSFYARIRRGGVESTIYSRAELKGRCRKDIPAWMCEIAHYVLGPFRVSDLWHEALGIPGHGLTLRRPNGQGRPEEVAVEEADVSLDIEVCDGHHGHQVLVPRHRKSCVQGSGALPDAVEMCLWCLQPGQSAEVCQNANFGKLETFEGPEHPGFPLFFRVWLHSRAHPGSSGPETATPMASSLHKAKVALKEKRFLLALLRLHSFWQTLKFTTPDNSLQEDFLRQLLICEHRLGLQTARRTANQLVQLHDSARNLMLRARVRLATEASRALRDITKAMELDPSCCDPQLLQRAKKHVKRQKRTRRWFDGRDVEERSLEAHDPHRCFQCHRVRDGHTGEMGTKMERKYLCKDCWQCWWKIRRCQEAELKRQVEKATYSDYSTATDELPSLDDKPRDWDSRHPMWNRQSAERPDWQHGAYQRRGPPANSPLKGSRFWKQCRSQKTGPMSCIDLCNLYV
ncbi:Uncharacterized protein SCF082_LOCUS21377 [Durusdinium trenchii]|uniref:Mannosyltransferase n=1 Tax=Durusdinium trenchii TaxID=1381693 RepID=A0ABP0LAK8_9DINO